MEIEILIKREFSKKVIEEILKAGYQQNYFYARSHYTADGYRDSFRSTGISQAAKDLTEGNEDEIHSIIVNIEDTYIPLLILKNDKFEGYTSFIVNGLPYFWSKEFMNSDFPDRIKADYARYFRALFRWLKDFPIVDLIFCRDSDERDPVLDVADEFRSISIGFDLRYLKKGDELKHFYTNSLIHGYEFADNKGNKVEFEEIKNTLDARESLKLYFTAQGYPIELRVYSFSISLEPLEPFKKVSKENEELLLDWPFYIEVALQLIEGFWIDDFRIM